MYTITTTGSTKRTEQALRKMLKLRIPETMSSGGSDGVSALAHATPVDSGLAQESWGFDISSSGGKYELTWTNTDVENGYPVVIMIQYGHGTGSGGYVPGRDFINPAIKPIFDKITDKVWKEVTSA